MFHAQSLSVKHADCAGAEENHIACRQELLILIQEQQADIGLRICNFVYASSTHIWEAPQCTEVARSILKTCERGLQCSGAGLTTDRYSKTITYGMAARDYCTLMVISYELILTY